MFAVGAPGEEHPDVRQAGELLAQAQALYGKGRLAEAEERCRQIISVEPGGSAAFHLLGLIVFQAGRREEGIRLVERATHLAPGDAAAQSNLGIMRNAMGDLRGSREALQIAVALAPGDANVHYKLGITLDGLEDHEGAMSAYLNAVRIAPHNISARLALANHFSRYNDFKNAVIAYRAALELGPRNIYVRLGLARVLLSMGQASEALEQAKEAVAVGPGSADAYAVYASALDALGRTEDALAACRKSALLAPASAGILINHMQLLHRSGDVQTPIRECENFLARHGCNIEVLALLAFLYDEAGDKSARDRILDVRAIQAGRLTPDGYPDTGSFLHELIQAVTAHPTLKDAPENHATRYGKHSAELFTGETNVFDKLERQFRTAVDDYGISSNLPDVPAYRQARPRRYKLASWAVIMESQGHQVPHIHPSAWVSGVVYLQVPDVVERDVEAHSGWIEFGLPPESYGARAAPHVHLEKPEPGKFFLFPSYYFHRTIPFQSDMRRICIAFDAVPV